MGKAAPASLANVLPALKSRKMSNHDADDVRNLKRETVEQVDEGQPKLHNHSLEEFKSNVQKRNDGMD